jgi:hypothetical protein
VIDVADQLGLQRPLTLFGAYNEGDVSDRKLLRALTQTCRHLAADFDWQVLQERHSFTTIAAEIQTAGLPADFDRAVLDTAWDETLRRRLCGPLNAQEWAEAKSGTIGRIEPAFAIMGDTYRLSPTPLAGSTIAFTYIRKAIGKNDDGDLLARFAADTDTTLWDDELITLGMVMNHLKNDHEAYASEQLDFEKMKADWIKRDGGGRVLRMGGAAKSSDDMVRRMKSAALIVPES